MTWRLAFAGVVIAVALSLAVATSLFSILDGLLFRPLPFPAADQLVMIDFAPVAGKLPPLAFMPELSDKRNEIRARVLSSPMVAAAAQADFSVFFDADIAAPLRINRDDVIVVNEALARQLSPSAFVMGVSTPVSVLGRRLRTVSGKGEVIGVIRDFIEPKLNLPAVPQSFMPDRRSLAAAAICVRLKGPVETGVPQIQLALEETWGRLSPSNFRLMRDELQPVLAPYQGQSILLSLIVLCCLPIVAVGLVSALNQAVRVRTQEIAIRMALGADPAGMRRSVVLGALRTVSIGAVLGIACGAAIGRVIAGQLFNVEPVDLATIVAVSLGLILLGLGAAAVPARRASRINPASALREA